jgi:hypothetical protein
MEGLAVRLSLTDQGLGDWETGGAYSLLPLPITHPPSTL